MWICIYYTYGNWKTTCGFPSEKEANKHADMYLRRPEKDYIKHVEVRWLELPVIGDVNV